MTPVSVFTPSHDPQFLDDCHRSLREQTVNEWRWTVVLNGEAAPWEPSEPDERVSVHRAPSDLPKGIGAAKALACSLAGSDILVELDHDDVLTPTCLAEVRDALLEDAAAPVVFSDFANVHPDLTPYTDHLYDVRHGWDYRQERIAGVDHLRLRSFEATPHNLGYIWYAPHHVRAYRRSAYEAAGGYDPHDEILDDQMLMLRLYLRGEFRHLERTLYLQRIHNRNTWRTPEANALIQQRTAFHYRQHIESLLTAWGARRGLTTASVVVGASHCVSGPDVVDAVEVDGMNPSIPLADDSVSLIRCVDVLQRLHDRASFFNECYRVLAHGGMVLSTTASTDGRGAFQDPSHVSYWNENSIWYLTQQYFRPCIPDLRARFQVSYLGTDFPSDWHRTYNIPYVHANLMAVKDGPRQGGPLLS